METILSSVFNLFLLCTSYFLGLWIGGKIGEEASLGLPKYFYDLLPGQYALSSSLEGFPGEGMVYSYTKLMFLRVSQIPGGIDVGMDFVIKNKKGGSRLWIITGKHGKPILTQEEKMVGG